ncbi:MAG: hypothetical protein AB7I27_02735 [Bacteriovoracaceae bacterium]
MKKTAFFVSLAFATSALAYEAQIRKGELSADLETLLNKARTETGVKFNTSNFQLIEKRELATSHFTMYVQTSSGVPVANTAIRTWTNKTTGELILGELHLDEKSEKNEDFLAARYRKAKFSAGALKSIKLSNAIENVVQSIVSAHDTDTKIIGMKFKDQWVNGDLVREVQVRGRRGIHQISISLLRNAVVSKSYFEFPQSEATYNLKAYVFPINEEVEGTGQRQPYELKEIKYISSSIRDGGEKPLGTLSEERFSEMNYNPLLAETPNGKVNGFWSEASLRSKAESQVEKLPLVENSFSNGLLLQGKFATINLHPAAKDAFKDINFSLKPSVHHIVSWGPGENGFEARALTGWLGKTIQSQEELLTRIPFRHPEHDATSYINAGFDEVQVYYGVTALMEALNEMGFSDPVLSTSPFHAFLYDPDISMRDNAYYWDNTINFTTYSPDSANYARDNPTIWHELGHGVMDRLMGPFLSFADSKGGYGGLSEGMADFVAALVIEYQTAGENFPGKSDMRIVNQTGFYLTNEFHDEGEAYGGVMNDMLQTVIAKEDRAGLFAFTDLTLETMRLTRNHPALTARGWFEHMLLADELGSDVRAPGKFREIMIEALSARNFAFNPSFTPAQLKVSFDGTILTGDSKASREKPMVACGQDGKASYTLDVALTSGDANFIKYPATVKVEYRKGALQGAIKWDGETNNPNIYQISNEAEALKIPLTVSMECDYINQPDGSCKDYAYIQVYNPSDKKPVAKKRFYLKVFDKKPCQEQ